MSDDQNSSHDKAREALEKMYESLDAMLGSTASMLNALEPEMTAVRDFSSSILPVWDRILEKKSAEASPELAVLLSLTGNTQRALFNLESRIVELEKRD